MALDDECKVYYLFDEDERRQAADHLQGQIYRVNEEMAQVWEDLRLVKRAEDALDEILALLARMREIATQAATDPTADRSSLNRELDALKGQIDAVAARQYALWSPEEAQRIRAMVAAVDKLRL